MQETRQHILNILKQRGEATVEELVEELRERRGDSITAVTVRHHLNELLKEQLITNPQQMHRTTPGRPRHVYMLTEKAKEYFPNNYEPLAATLLEQIASHFPQPQVNVIMEGVADRMAVEAGIPHVPLAERMDKVVDYLNEHGYNAEWEKENGGFVLRTVNCPYHHIVGSGHTLCDMDMRLVASLLGIVPRLMSRMSEGDNSCAYFIPEPG